MTGPVGGEQRVELGLVHPVRVLGLRLQAHQVHHVDHPDPQVRQVLAEDAGRRQHLHRGHVTGAGQHHVGLLAVGVVAGPFPDPGAPGAVQDGVVHVQPVGAGLLARHDDVHVVPAAQAVVTHREQRVGVRGQVHPDDLRLLVHHVVDEPRVLVAEPVVVLPPHVRGEQVVQRGDRAPPGQRAGGLQPLRVLVEHRVHDVDERLVAGEQPVPAGQQVALQPALAGGLGQDLHDPAVAGQVLVYRQRGLLPGLARDLEQRVQPVRLRLVRADHPEVLRGRVELRHVAEHVAQHPGRLRHGRAGPVHGHRVLAEVGQVQVAQQQAAVGVRVGAHPALAGRDEPEDLAARLAVAVEQLVRAVGPHPLLELAQVGRVGAHLGQRHLVRPPGALHREPVHLGRAGPALRGAHDDHRPALAGAAAVAGGAVTGLALDLPDPGDDVVQHAGHLGVHDLRVGPGDEHRRVAVAAQQRVQLLLGDPGQHRRVGDLPAIQVQDRKDRAVPGRVQELAGVPAGGQRPGFRLAVADDAGHDEIRVVERGAVRMGQGVAQLAALVDGTRRLGGDVAGYPARERELAEQPPHAGEVARDARVNLAVAAVQPGVRDRGRPAVAWADHIHHVQAVGHDHPVQVRPEEVQPRRGAPVPEQPRLDVLGPERLLQHRVGHQVDLPDGQVVRGSPVPIEGLKLIAGEFRPGGHGHVGGAPPW